MSIKVMTAVWEHSQHKGASLLLLLAIADHAHDDGGGAFPAVGKLAQKIRMSARQVQRILHLLEASGELSVAWGQGPNGTNRYTVRLDRLPPRQDVTPDRMSPPTNRAAGGDTSSGRGDVAVSPEPSPNRHESSGDVPRSRAGESPAERLARLRRAVRPTGVGRR